MEIGAYLHKKIYKYSCVRVGEVHFWASPEFLLIKNCFHVLCSYGVNLFGFKKIKMRAFSLALVLVLLCEYTNSFSGNELERQSVFYGLALTASRRDGKDTQCKLQLSDVQAAVLNNTRWAVKRKFFLYFYYRPGGRPPFIHRNVAWNGFIRDWWSELNSQILPNFLFPISLSLTAYQ